MNRLTVDALDVRDKRVFVRVDFNVPLNPNRTIRTDARIRAALPTIRLLLDRQATVILASHLGKPDGRHDPGLSLHPVAEQLGKLLDREVTFAPDCVGPETEKLIRDAAPGSVILLENLRFHPGEEANDPDFSRQLAGLADRYVNDAFGTAHRAHASMAGMTMHFQRPAAGLLMKKEIEYLGRVMEAPARPFVTLIGGGKIKHKAAVAENLLPKVDRLLIGGGAMFNFLKARRAEIGKSIYEPDMVERAGELATDHKLVLPADVVVAPGLDAGDDATVVPVYEIPPDRMGLDIGPATARLYSDVLRKARTIVWAGPMGVFEQDAFAHGSETVTRAIVKATESGAVSVVGGGDTIACLVKFDSLDRVSHASTGGGACLDFLAGRSLPGITALHKEE